MSEAPTLSPESPAAQPWRVAPLHSGVGVGSYLLMYILGAAFPLFAGCVLFGWRAIGSVALVVLGAVGATAAWKRIGLRGHQLRYGHAIWLSLILALTLPAHLFQFSTTRGGTITAPWAVLVTAGMLLVMFTWVLGGIGAGRVSSVLITLLLLFVMFKDLLAPHSALQRRHVLTGDLLHALELPSTETTHAPWIHAADVPGFDAIRSEPASERLSFYTTGIEKPERSFLSLEMLLRDRMPPLEDLIVGGHPSPIGTGCAVAVIIGGLFLMYRGLIDYRVPLFAIIGAYIGFLTLPIPVIIRETTREWRWLAMREPGIGWPFAVTFANYEIMSSPLLFTAFFLATSPAVRPMARRARVIYALLIGILSAGFQLYAYVAIGPYVALLAVSLMTPFLDKLFAPRTLV